MGVTSGVYRLVLVLHLVAAIAGFGGIFFNGVSRSMARGRSHSERIAIAETNLAVTAWAEWCIYAVPLLGIALIILSDKVWQFSQFWVSASFLLYVILLGLMRSVQLPTVRRITQVMADGPSEELSRLEGKADTVTAAINLLVVAAVILMVFKPGT